MPTESISLHVRQGYFAFQDYAVQYCLDHFERCTRLESQENIFQQTMESAREFLAAYSLPVPQDLAALSHRDLANFFGKLPKDKRERASKFSIGYRTLDIRTVIEQIRTKNLLPEENALIRNLHGKELTYKCPKVWCDCFSNGFDNDEDRQKHVDSHDRPFRCPEEGCFAFQLGYSSEHKLEEHRLKYHSPEDEEVRFPKTIRPRDNDTLVDAAGRNDLSAMLAFSKSGAAVKRKLIGNKQKLRIPICRAAENGNVEACKLLLEWGVTLRDFDNFDANSPMHLAIKYSHLDLVHFLVSRPMIGVDHSAMSSWMGQACEQGQPDIVRILLESSHFKSRGIEEWKPYALSWIQRACWKSVDNPDNVAIVEYLLEQGFSDCVHPVVLSTVKNRGGDYMTSLLGPIIDRQAYLDVKTKG